jgi:hypothetical protein
VGTFSAGTFELPPEEPVPPEPLAGAGALPPAAVRVEPEPEALRAPRRAAPRRCVRCVDDALPFAGAPAALTLAGFLTALDDDAASCAAAARLGAAVLS